MRAKAVRHEPQTVLSKCDGGISIAFTLGLNLYECDLLGILFVNEKI
jgi:hypothetical protein